jgi:hypothetical protein
MEPLELNSVGTYLNPVLEYLQVGFDRVNAAQGLAIALIATILMRKWLQLPSLAFAATVLNAVVDAIVPIVAGRTSVRLPPVMEPSYWQYLAAMFVGHFIVIGIFFSLKKIGYDLASKRDAAPAPAPAKKK